ncbi:hypothetical protein HYH02_015148 [Chlamydomonas schloesseri]|nr:hypothetical protein HYH02_015148 [Chlamydomonas schloesseri]|eukprot:KAG2424668.1 hypothetical protein HYH02_015148 [Chlamydomonas schloesseri]
MTPSCGPSSSNPAPASAASAAAAPGSQNQQGARRRRRPGGFMLVVAAGVAGVAAWVALTVKQTDALSQDQATIKGRLDSLERSALRLPWPSR